MATLTLSNPTLTNPADKSEVETNFAEVCTAINGNLANDNIIAGAGIETSKLAARDYEFVVRLAVHSAPAAAPPPDRPPASATVPIAVCSLPGLSTEGGAYTVLSGGWYISDDGDAAATTTFSVQLGYAGGGPGWTTVATTVAATNITGSGQNQQSGALVIGTAAISLHAATAYHFGLFLTALGANALNAAHSHLDVTLKLRRTDGLRTT
jgi:hypothetical protein